jgi:hypothetical protein
MVSAARSPAASTGNGLSTGRGPIREGGSMYDPWPIFLPSARSALPRTADVIIRVARGAPATVLKLCCCRPEHKVASRAIVKGEMAATARSAGVSRRDDSAPAPIAAKDWN